MHHKNLGDMLKGTPLLSCKEPSLAQPQGVPVLAACTYTSRLQAMARFRFHRLEGSRTGWPPIPDSESMDMRGGAVLYFMQGIQEVCESSVVAQQAASPSQDEQHARGLLSGVPLLGTICTCKA